MTIQGGVSSAMSWKRLAVLLVGMPGKTAPRRMKTDRKLYASSSVLPDRTRGRLARRVAQLDNSSVSPMEIAVSRPYTSPKIAARFPEVNG